MPRKPATDEQRTAARGRLQAAASAVVAEVGVTGVTARAIADRAGVSVGTIYSYFGSLQGLMQSLWMEPLDRINARLRATAGSTTDPVERVRRLLEAYVSVATNAPELFRGAFLFVRPDSLGKPPKEALEAPVFGELLVAAIREGQSGGAIRPGDPRRLAQFAWSAVHGSLALPANFDRIELLPGPEIASDMIDAVIENLARPPGSAQTAG